MKDEDAKRRGYNAEKIITDPLWVEAWAAYREKLLGLIEKTDSNNVEVILQAKRMLAAGVAAKSYLEAIVTDGKVAAETLRLEEERKKGGGRRA